MTDKVQKIREEAERLQKRAEHNFDISLTENERQFWLGESNVLTLIGKYIDSMQEEPKKCMYTKDNYTDEDRKILCDGCEEECKFKSTTSVWHDGNEKPLNDKYVLAYIEPGYFEVGRHAGVIDSFYYGSFATDWEHIIKWAHIDDILKL